MNTEKDRPNTLLFIIGLILFNAIVTGLHFLLIILNVIPIRGELTALIEVASADILTCVLPSFAVVYGLWRQRAWGWGLAYLVAGGYIHGQLLLLSRFQLNNQLGTMALVSLLIIVFHIFMVFYLWRIRHRFFDPPPHVEPLPF